MWLRLCIKSCLALLMASFLSLNSNAQTSVGHVIPAPPAFNGDPQCITCGAPSGAVDINWQNLNGQLFLCGNKLSGNYSFGFNISPTVDANNQAHLPYRYTMRTFEGDLREHQEAWAIIKSPDRGVTEDPLACDGIMIKPGLQHDGFISSINQSDFHLATGSGSVRNISLKPSGRVGINHLYPTAALSVGGSIDATGDMEAHGMGVFHNKISGVGRFALYKELIDEGNNDKLEIDYANGALHVNNYYTTGSTGMYFRSKINGNWRNQIFLSPTGNGAVGILTDQIAPFISLQVGGITQATGLRAIHTGNVNDGNIDVGRSDKYWSLKQRSDENDDLLLMPFANSDWQQPLLRLRYNQSLAAGANGFFNLTPNGRVGIGTSDPQHTLQVEGRARAFSFRALHTGDANNPNDGVIDIGSSLQHWHIAQRFQQNRDLIFTNTTNGAWNPVNVLTLRYNNSLSAGANNALHINPAGRVAMGLPAEDMHPNAQLHVNGTIRATNLETEQISLTGGGRLATITATSTAGVLPVFTDNEGQLGDSKIRFNADNNYFEVGANTDKAGLFVAGDIQIGSYPLQTGSSPRLKFFGGSEISGLSDNGDQIFFQRVNEAADKSTLRLNIADDPNTRDKFEIGYYSVGNTWNQSVAIYNNGELWAKKVKVTLDNFPDYVFKPGYKLRSLQETEDFITQNGHLPDVPCAEDIAENGADLGELNKILLKKIEELTLHLIQMQKEIETLKNNK